MPAQLANGEYICLRCKERFPDYETDRNHGGHPCPNPPRCGWCGKHKPGWMHFATMFGVHGWYCDSCL